MKNWQATLVAPDATMRDAVATIDASGLQIAMVQDADRHLLGTVTDGDIRRGILRGVSLDAAVAEVMNPNPVTAREHDDRETLLALMHRRHLHQVPVLDTAWRLVGLEVLDELLNPERRQNPIVLMAGGLGSRLRPLTDDCPKPMLRVGSKPILETILESFASYGFHRFYVAVNYMGEVIEEYFGDGSKWGVEIEYLRERERLGTAGALSLLPEPPAESFFVMNADLLTQLNFAHLLDFHESHKATATMCVREYEMQVPYGVIEARNHRILKLHEKPTERYLVNAGVYVLRPDVLSMIPESTFFDMTDLFERAMEQGDETAVFPVREYWRDIGRVEDFKEANGDFGEVFR